MSKPSQSASPAHSRSPPAAVSGSSACPPLALPRISIPKHTGPLPSGGSDGHVRGGPLSSSTSLQSLFPAPTPPLPETPSVSSHRHHLVDRGFSPQTFSPAPTNVHHSFPAVTSALANDNAANATVIGHNCSPPPLLASTAAAAPASMAVPTVAPSTTVASPPIAWRRKLVLVLVGLPARGKSYISYKLLGYLRWRGLHANLFNVGRHRRNVAEQHDTKQSSDFFSPENTNAKQQRDEIAMEVLECMLDWLGQGGDVSIFDATNCFDSADHELFTSIGWLSLDGVLSHFSKNATLDVGCYVDGELVFKPITRSDVTIAEGKFQFVRFESQSAKNGANQAVSLVVTDNHRMYGRLGAATYAKSSGQYFWPKKGTVEEPPPYAVHQASAVLKGATEHAHANFQLQSMFELGKVAESNLLPFAEPLGLTTTDHIDAFLWLYGYWCGDGWLDNKQAVCFGPRKKKDMATLDAVFGRLPLLKLESGGTGKDGYWRAENLSKGQRYYFIYAPAWWELFAGQYGHKYSGEAAKAAATADAEDINSAKWFWWWVFKRLERDQLRSVLSGLRFADGAEAEASESGGHIFTSSERFRDEIERVCVTAGYSTHVYMRFEEGSTHGVNEQGVTFVCRTRAWAVHYSTETRSAQVRLVVGKEVQAEPEARQAKVWCVSVPTTQQLIMVRRVVKRDDDGEPIEWSRGVVVGNTTAARRQLVLSRCQARSIDLRVIFLESICDDARVLESNYRVKVANSPDYKGMSQEDALKDLRERVRNYERVYESIQDDELSYIKLHNLASKVICNRIHGQLSHSIAAYLMSIHIGRRPIFFVRAGHSESERTSDKQQQTKSEAIGSAATTAAAPSTSSTSEPAGGGVEGGKDDLPSQQFQDRQILKLPEDLTTAAAVAKASAHPSISSGTGGQEYNIPYTVAMAANLDKHGKKFASRLAHFITHKVEEYTAQKEMQDRELAASYAGKEKELEASYDATQGATGSPPRANLAITVPAGSTASSSVAASTTSPPTASDTHLPLVVYTSTLPRAIQTASLLQDRAYICEHQSSLNMVDTGVCSGLTIEEIKEKMPWELQKWAKHKYKYRFPGGESQADRAKSLEPLVFELERQTLPVLVVSHMSTLQVLLGFFYGSKRSVDSYYSLWIPQHTVLELIPHQYGWLHSSHDLSDAACEDDDLHDSRPSSLPASPKNSPVPVELGVTAAEEVERFNLQVVQPSRQLSTAVGHATPSVPPIQSAGSSLSVPQHDRSISIPPPTQAPTSSSSASAASSIRRKGSIGKSSTQMMLGETDFYAQDGDIPEEGR